MATAAAAGRDIPRILIVDDVEANRFILKDVIAVNSRRTPTHTETGEKWAGHNL